MAKAMKRPAEAAATPRRRASRKVAEELASPGPTPLRRRISCKQAPRRRYTTKRPPREDEPGSSRKRARAEDFLPPPQADVSVPLRRIVYLMRGPPGCGKSTAARSLLAQHLAAQDVGWQPGPGAGFSPVCRAFIHSTDDYFTHVDEVGKAEYKFNPKQIGDNHKRNQARCEAAMELGLTPLFVDNTNIALWEMREYVHMADRFRYTVRVVDPRDLSHGALDPEVLQQRCAGDAGDRAAGKAIGFQVLERMAKNFEELPSESEDSAVLQALRSAKAPWELREKLPVYAGLDVEARALAALGGVELGPHFWGAKATEGPAPCGEHYVDARYAQDSGWLLPDRLHVTVQFFGFRAKKEDILEAQALVGTWHEVEAHALVYVRGGGLLCAACRLVGESAGLLHGLAGEGWWPHITLLTAKPWRAVDSTAVLRAWDAAVAAAARGPSNGATAAGEQAAAAEMPPADSAVAGVAAAVDGVAAEAAPLATAASTEEAAAPEAAAPEAAAPEAAAPEAAAPEAAAALEAKEAEPLTATSPAPEVAVAEVAASAEAKQAESEAAQDAGVGVQSESAQQEPRQADTAQSEPAEAELPKVDFDGRCQTFRDVLIMGRQVDLCVIPLDPPRPLGKCQFRLFHA